MGNSLSCDSPLTTACLGLTDPRYDPSASDELLNQDALWGEYAGRWGPEERNYAQVGGGGRLPTFYNVNEKTGWPYKSDAFTVYRTITIEETRFRSQAIYLYEAAPAEFCAQTPPEGLLNTIGDAVCGENGNYQIIEQFGASTYERDGTIKVIWQNQGPESDETSGPPTGESTLTAVDDNAVFWYIDIPNLVTAAETFTFTGEGRNLLMGVATATDTKHARTSENFQQIMSMSLSPRMDAATFLPALRRAFKDHGVKDDPAWLATESLPDCLAEPWGKCPSDEDWCSTGKDPSCSTSTYQEPGASLNAGGISLIFIAIIVVLTGIFVIVGRHIAKKQRDRYKTKFASQVAQRIEHRGSISQMDPAELVKEFQSIETSGNGQIEKEELWKFVSSGKAGEMSKKDFDALFAAMDVNGDGVVSFLEFCAFMTTCGKEYRQESTRRLSGMDMTAAASEIAALVDKKKIN